MEMQLQPEWSPTVRAKVGIWAPELNWTDELWGALYDWLEHKHLNFSRFEKQRMHKQHNNPFKKIWAWWPGQVHCESFQNLPLTVEPVWTFNKSSHKLEVHSNASGLNGLNCSWYTFAYFIMLLILVWLIRYWHETWLQSPSGFTHASCENPAGRAH